MREELHEHRHERPRYSGDSEKDSAKRMDLEMIRIEYDEKHANRRRKHGERAPHRESLMKDHAPEHDHKGGRRRRDDGSCLRRGEHRARLLRHDARDLPDERDGDKAFPILWRNVPGWPRHEHQDKQRDKRRSVAHPYERYRRDDENRKAHGDEHRAPYTACKREEEGTHQKISHSFPFLLPNAGIPTKNALTEDFFSCLFDGGYKAPRSR